MYNKKIYLQLSGKEFAALLPPLVVSSIKRIILFADNKTSIKQILKAFFRTFRAIIEVFRWLSMWSCREKIHNLPL